MNLHNNKVSTPFQYVNNIKGILEDRGMDHMFGNLENLSVDALKAKYTDGQAQTRH